MAQFAIRALCALMPCVTSSLAAAETVKIGFNAPLSGFAAADGNSALLGAELAVEEANAAGGVDGKQLELVVYDDQASPKEAVEPGNGIRSTAIRCCWRRRAKRDRVPC